MNNSIYRAYALFLMQNLSQIVNDGVGMDIDIYPCTDANNTVILIKFNNDDKSSYTINEGKSLLSALTDTGVTKFYAPVTGTNFEGTNTFVSSDRIIYVKENNIELFSEDAVVDNVLTLVKHRLGKDERKDNNR